MRLLATSKSSLFLVLLSSLLLTACLHDEDEGAAPESSALSGPRVFVYKDLQRRQCTNDGYTVAQRGSELTAALIPVSTSYCAGWTLGAFPAVCGGGTGLVGVYEIPASAETRAGELGFSRIDPTAYQRTEC